MPITKPVSLSKEASPQTTGFSVIQTLPAKPGILHRQHRLRRPRYYYRIKAFNTDTESSYSNTATILVVTAPPAAPPTWLQEV